MAWQRCGGLAGATLFLCLGGCGPKAPSGVQVEGGSDSEQRYDELAPLPAPPAIDPSAPGATYLIQVAEKIQPAWGSFLEDCRLRLPPTHELNASSLVTELAIATSREGEVVSVRIGTPSGNSEFDKVALEIAGDLGQLPAPPAEWISDDDRLHLRWSFARDQRQAGPVGASFERVELPLVQAVPKLLERGQIAQAARRLVKSESADIEALLRQIAQRALEDGLSEGDPSVAALALDAVAAAKLGALAPGAREAVLSPDKRLAMAAARALAVVGGEQDLELLSGLAGGQAGVPPELSAAAALALVELGHEQRAVAVASAGLASSEEVKRLAAMAVFSTIESEASVSMLAGVLSGKIKAPRGQRVAAARALGRQAVQARVALKALLATIDTGDAAVRAASVRAIASAARMGLRGRGAFWKVLGLLKNKDTRVRAAAIEAAAALDGPRFAKELGGIRAGGSDAVLLSFATALVSVPGDLALRHLLDLAAVDNVSLRIAATRSLIRRGDPGAKLTLRGLLGDEAPEVRLAALESLETADELRPFLADKSLQVQIGALRSLVAIAGPGPTAEIVAARLASSGKDRATQVLWASAWLAGK